MTLLAFLFLLIGHFALHRLLLFLFLQLLNSLGEVLLKHAVKNVLELLVLRLLLFGGRCRRSNAARFGRRVLEMIHHELYILLELDLFDRILLRLITRPVLGHRLSEGGGEHGLGARIHAVHLIRVHVHALDLAESRLHWWNQVLRGRKRGRYTLADGLGHAIGHRKLVQGELSFFGLPGLLNDLVERFSRLDLRFALGANLRRVFDEHAGSLDRLDGRICLYLFRFLGKRGDALLFWWIVRLRRGRSSFRAIRLSKVVDVLCVGQNPAI